MARLIWLTHAEVVQDPAVPVPDWGLSDIGRARHEAGHAALPLARVGAVWSSAERKAREAGAIHADALGLPLRCEARLHENDRSATGYLPPAEFEATADAFFARPDESVRGWETARAAQARVLAALDAIRKTATGDILVVAHGAVGALLRAHLRRREITRAEDQPSGGGCWFEAGLALDAPPSDWRRL